MIRLDRVRSAWIPLLISLTGIAPPSPFWVAFAIPVRSTSPALRLFTSLPEIQVPEGNGDPSQPLEGEALSQPEVAVLRPQAVHHHHHHNQNGFVRVYESEYDHVHHTHGHHEHRDISPAPHLAAGNGSSNVSTIQRVFLSKTATLDCKVFDVHEEPVSWMRQVGEMLRLLSYDKNVYATNDRYALQYESGHGWKRWKLIIARVEEEDRGLYRCQVATKPSLVLDVMLNVTEPRTRIMDERGSDVVEKHYNSGSMIELKCLVDRIPAANDPVVWKKQNIKLSFNTSRGGISEKRDKATGVITSRLYVVRASPRDSGVYSCWYGNLSSAVITVHVIAGENSAAMQHDSVADEASGCASALIFGIFKACPLLMLLMMVLMIWQDCFSVAFLVLSEEGTTPISSMKGIAPVER